MYIKEDSDLAVPHCELVESHKDLKEMREQSIAIFYGWGMPVL